MKMEEMLEALPTVNRPGLKSKKIEVRKDGPQSVISGPIHFFLDQWHFTYFLYVKHIDIIRDSD